MFRYLANLVSNEALLTDDPSSFSVLGFPSNKRKWAAQWKDPDTKHCFLSGWEGLSRNERISKHNPPVTCRGVIVDLDCAPVELNFSKGYEPSFISRSFSGGYHLHYLFENPLNLGNVSGLASKFMETLETKLSLPALPGYDKKAFRNPSQYYEVGREWAGEGKPLEDMLIHAWFMCASKKFRFKDSGDAAIPIDRVREYLSEKYPNKWPGGWESFEVGSRGVRFWDDDGDSFSVIVRETGLTCFTSDRGFIPWRDEELLGSKEVSHYQETALTDPSRDIWFDSKSYWKPNAHGRWVCRNETQIKEDLHCMGLSNRSPEGGGASPVSRAAMHIRDDKQLKVISMFYTRPGVRHPNNPADGVELNIGNVSALTPAPSSAEWGERFPRLQEFFEEFFVKEPRERFLAHLAHAYRCGVNEDPQRGLGCIIAGPVGNGKTFTANQICGRLLGGVVDASPYLVDGDNFNENLVTSPVWTLDDVANKASWSEHSRFSKKFKRVLANDDLPCRAMYQAPIMIRWTGRIYMTANDDYESLNALPRTDINIKDKLLILKANAVNIDPWITNEELEEELPHLGAWLLDYTHEPSYLGGRFGIRPWVDPELEKKILEVGPKAPGDEVLAAFRKGLTEPFVGLCSELYDRIVVDNSGAAGKIFKKPTQLGWHLKDKLDAGDPGYEKKRTRDGMVYTIQPLEEDETTDADEDNAPF